jgi:CRP-like cAMP-binding protein
MKEHVSKRKIKFMAAREILNAHESSALWRIDSGTMRIDTLDDAGIHHFVRLAIQGDVLGVENIAGLKEKIIVSALTPVQLQPLELTQEKQLTPLLFEALKTSHQRCREMVSLRTGVVEERVRRLLLMLVQTDAQISESQDCNLPSLGNIAEIVHSTPETVCRILASLRKQRLIEKVTPTNIRSKGLDYHRHRLVTSLN